MAATKFRVSDIAKRMGKSEKDVMFQLQSLGAEITDANQTLEPEVIQALISGKHLSLGLSAGVVTGVLLSVTLFTSLGVSVGVITRNQPAAVVVLVGTFVAEKILDTFIGHAGAYLPFGLLDPLLGLSGATISRGAAALTLAGIATGFGLLATVLLLRRDVT